MSFKYFIEQFNASEGLSTQKAQRLIKDNVGIGQIPLRTRRSIPPHLQDNGSDYDLQLSYTLPGSLDSFDPSDLLNPLSRDKRRRHPQRLFNLPKNF